MITLIVHLDVQATTGSGGWPLNVFLTPDLEPVFGGTYFPGPDSVSNVGSVSFLDLLGKLKNIWQLQEQRCRESAKEITAKLRQFAEEGVHSHSSQQASEPLDLDLLEEAYRTIAHAYDRTNGGFSSAPKFPTPIRLKFLLQLGQWPAPVTDIIGGEEIGNAAKMALHTLRQILRGGIRDHVGFGFARYSVTKDWSLPHFEKMLYDQAQLLDVYTDAFLLTRDTEFLASIYDIATYLTTPPMAREGGGFFSSEDADSAPSFTDKEKIEGAFYVWTQKTLSSILTAPHEAEVVTRFYNVKADGNIDAKHDPHDELMNQNVFSIVDSPNKIGKDLGLLESNIISIIRSARLKLRKYRDTQRPRPALDDKIVVNWNGLAIASLARASTAIASVDSGTSKTWLNAALAAATFIKTTMWDENSSTLWRIFRETRAPIRGLADDYAALILGAIELYGATFDEAWLRWADELQKAQIRDFAAPDGGFYTTPNPASSSPSATSAITEGSDLLMRLKQGMDGAEPSANALSAGNLCRLGSLLEDEEYVALAKKTIGAFEAEIEQYPSSFPGMLSAVAWLAIGGKGVWVVGGDDADESKALGEPTVDAKEAAETNPGSSKDPKAPFTASGTLRRLRSQAGVGRTILRVRAKDDWLRARNPLVLALDVKEGDPLKVVVCEQGACRDVEGIEGL